MSINIDNLDNNLVCSEDWLFNDGTGSDKLQELSDEELKISGGYESGYEVETISVAIGGESFTINGDGVNVVVPEAVANSDRFITSGDNINVTTYKGNPNPFYYGDVSINITRSRSSNSVSNS